ncbi:MAG TPA: hypothetical protein VFT45_03190 [Longimicrobium sp.]|nr:hypothetical protein [Longimicrobium sp.]
MVFFNQSELTNAQVVIQNAGAGTAKDLQISFEPPLQSSHGWEVSKYFETAKPILPPGARIEHVFDTWASYLKSELPRLYKVRIRYVGAETNIRYETEQTLDITALQHLLGLEHKKMHDLVHEVSKLTKTVKSELSRIAKQLERNAVIEEFTPAGYQNARNAVAAMLSTWDALQRVGEDPTADQAQSGAEHFLRRVGYDAVRAGAIQSLPALGDTLIRILQILHRPRFLDDDRTTELAQAYEELKQHLAGIPQDGETLPVPQPVSADQANGNTRDAVFDSAIEPEG